MGPEMANPYTAAAVEGGGMLIDVIGMIMQKQAWDEAKAEAKQIDYRNFNYMTGRDKEADRMNREALKLSKRRMNLEENQVGFDQMISKLGVTRSDIDRVGNLLNTNVALKNRTLQTWGR